MSDESSSEGWVKLQDVPPVPNLRFRRFRGESDYPHMVAVTEGMKEADQLELTISVEDITREFKHLEHSDPYRDFLLAEVDGKVSGYTRNGGAKTRLASIFTIILSIFFLSGEEREYALRCSDTMNGN